VVFFNYTTMQMTAKIVYYGPGLGGKTTNLLAIHQKTASGSRGEMVSLETETDRTLFFDLLPLDVGIIGGMKVRLQLYTVPGQVFYNATRKLVLKGVDGIVFVADSQVAALETNVESLANLKVNLAEMGLALDQIPLVLQYNKRDIQSIHGVDTLNGALNPRGVPFFEAAALHGIGVFETLKAISKMAIASVRRKLAEDTLARVPARALEPMPPAAPVAPVAATATAAPLRPPEPAELVAGLVPEAPRPEERTEDVTMEFAEEDTGQHFVRPVKTKGHLDIQQELEKLRTLTAAPASRPAARSSEASARVAERRLQDFLVQEQDARQDVKRKATLEVPARVLKRSPYVKVQLAFEDGSGGELLQEAVTVRLAGNRRLERLALHLDLEVKGRPD
jgi:signal recognition particle receptor subunit beta